MAVDPKALVRALFASRPVSRPPFIPLMATAAARFMQLPVKQMFSDATSLANALQSCQRLFRYDGIVVLPDCTLEAEACGCELLWSEGQPPEVRAPAFRSVDALESVDTGSVQHRGRIPAVQEAAGRLVQVAGRQVAVLGAITGPCTMGRHLLGEALSPSADATIRKLAEFWTGVAVPLARAYGELKLDGIIVWDPDLPALEAVRYEGIGSGFKTLRNVVNFYDAALMLQTAGLSLEQEEAIFGLEADGFAPGVLTPGPNRPSGKVLGLGIPAQAMVGEAGDVERSVLELKKQGGNVFLTIEGEVPVSTPALNMHRVMQVLAAEA